MRSPCLTQQQAAGPYPAVRVIKHIEDPYAGLKGHAYIKARNLNPPVQRVQTSAHNELVTISVEAGQ